MVFERLVIGAGSGLLLVCAIVSAVNGCQPDADVSDEGRDATADTGRPSSPPPGEPSGDADLYDCWDSAGPYMGGEEGGSSGAGGTMGDAGPYQNFGPCGIEAGPPTGTCFEVFDASLANAQAQAARQMDAVIASLKAAGIPESDIRTVGYSVTPQYEGRGQNQSVLRGYQVQNLVEVKSNNVPGLGALLDEIVTAGATRVYGIRFESDDAPRLKEQARDQAMQLARAKAEQLARNAGVTLGRPILIEESDTGDAVPVRADAVPAAAVRAAPTTPIQPGELQVRTIVRVVWAIQ